MLTDRVSNQGPLTYESGALPIALRGMAGQWPIALAVDTGGGCLDIFTLLYLFSPFSLCLGDSPI